MPDIAASPAAPHVTRREDYKPPEWLVPDLALDFTLGATQTLVRARLDVVRNGEHKAPLRLDASGLHILDVRLDGEKVNYWFENDVIRIPVPGDSAVIETEVAIAPRTNTQLMGLYESNGMLCTQCEAEGFRRITPFPDRPDVLSRYRVRMIAEKARYPVLLSNGDPVGAGELEGGKHWAEWDDPFPKPCYLFALVAGDLVANRDSFVTRSGREVDLAIWVRDGDLPRGACRRGLVGCRSWRPAYRSCQTPAGSGSATVVGNEASSGSVHDQAAPWCLPTAPWRAASTRSGSPKISMKPTAAAWSNASPSS